MRSHFYLTCPSCGSSQETTLSTTLLGFKKCECSACHKQIELPLISSARTIYWLWIGGFAAVFLIGLLNKQIFKPGLLMFLGAWTLYQDAQLRKSTASIQLKEVQPDPVSLKQTLWNKFKLLIVAIGVIILLIIGGMLYAVLST